MVINTLSGHTLSSFLISRRKYSRSSSSFCGSGACERWVCIPYLTESSFSRLSEKLSSCKRPELCRAAMFGVTMSRCHARWGGGGRVTMLAHSALGGEAARWPMYDRGGRDRELVWSPLSPTRPRPRYAGGMRWLVEVLCMQLTITAYIMRLPRTRCTVAHTNLSTLIKNTKSTKMWSYVIWLIKQGI